MIAKREATSVALQDVTVDGAFDLTDTVLLSGVEPSLGAVATERRGRSKPIVRLTAVKKRFGKFAALDGISLEVAPGEILGIIGRSGAGKSTLIRCLNGLEQPDEGSVEILGQPLGGLREADLRRIRARIGMIFQHFNLLSAKTVAENVALPLKIAGVSRSKRAGKVADLLHMVGLDGKANSYPAQLSGGQKQRVGIARALSADPALLLSDEATSALDPETTASILMLLRDVNRQLGLTVVMITHEMSVIRSASERVIVLDQGRIADEGVTSKLFASPSTELTRRLIGSSHHQSEPIAPERLEASYRPGHYAILRLVASGPGARQPIVSLIAEAIGAAPLVLQAGVERAGSAAIATLVVAVPEGGPARIAGMLAALRDTLSSHEVLGYAYDPI